MNAQALFEIVKDWPREVWPNDIDIEEGRGGWWYDTDSTSEISDDHAVMLFESAGLRWLYASDNIEAITLTIGGTAEMHYRIELDCFQDHTLRNRMKPGSVFVEGPTLIEAISKAIQEAR